MRMVVDKAGRTVIPKRLREQLRLAPGAELEARVEDGRLVAEPKGSAVVLVEENDRLVFRTTQPVASMTNEEWVQFIRDLREERLDDIMRGSMGGG
jgi:AbrB family looped-hinge helix DNA binding protein